MRNDRCGKHNGNKEFYERDYSWSSLECQPCTIPLEITQGFGGHETCQFPGSPDCVFGASLVPETFLEITPLPVCGRGFGSAS